MIRTFQTHRIRPQRELTGALWNFTPRQGEYAGKAYQLPTPSCWENHPDFSAYRGEGVYETQFSAGGNLRLECKGVSHTATVFLDGKQIAYHYNAYTAFDAVVPDVEPGTHTLSILADNRFGPESALHIPNDYMSYGGITRPVVLEQVADAFIKTIHVTPKQNGEKWIAELEVCIYGIRPERVDVTVEIAGKSISWKNVDIPSGSCKLSGRLELENVRVWMPDAPHLYEVVGRLYKDGQATDDLIDRFGFRQVTVGGNNIYINGEKLRIKGVCRHEDHPHFGCALPYAAMAYDLAQIRDLGANSVRTSHYPNDEVFLDLCDEMGILVWEENHARGLSEQDMRNPNFEEQAEQVIREMIPAHYNHPSIYIWGVLNECASETEFGRQCYQQQLSLIRRLDQSRPHSFASCKFKTDICFDLPDVVSYNIYPQWYHDTPVDVYLDDLYQWVQTETGGKGKPFIISEIGAGGLYGYRNNQHSHWTEEYQAEALRKQLTAVLQYPDCVGVYIWQFCDIRISEEWWGGRPRTMNNKGLVDEFRRPKLAYAVAREIFGTMK